MHLAGLADGQRAFLAHVQADLRHREAKGGVFSCVGSGSTGQKAVSLVAKAVEAQARRRCLWPRRQWKHTPKGGVLTTEAVSSDLSKIASPAIAPESGPKE